MTSVTQTQWPELMSLVTVAQYCDLNGSDTQRATALRAERFCKALGIPVLDIPGVHGKKVRRKDVDSRLKITSE